MYAQRVGFDVGVFCLEEGGESRSNARRSCLNVTFTVPYTPDKVRGVAFVPAY
jgi:hypothetical protein